MTKTEIKNLTELEKLRHKNKMLEIETERKAREEIEKLKFDQQMQLQRIKSAEIRRAIDRKANRNYMEENRFRG